jgi:hypothetical protein
MAAFIVVRAPETGAPPLGRRLGIFPGSATPTVFPAEVSFWVGYGFVSEPEDEDGSRAVLDVETRFELDVDGEPARMEETTVETKGQTLSKRCVASFPAGLPAGWHRFVGRWYDAGALVLSSDRSIEFLDR